MNKKHCELFRFFGRGIGWDGYKLNNRKLTHKNPTEK